MSMREEASAQARKRKKAGGEREGRSKRCKKKHGGAHGDHDGAKK